MCTTSLPPPQYQPSRPAGTPSWPQCLPPLTSLFVLHAPGDSPDTPDSLPPAVFDEYLRNTGKPIEASIRAELSGDFEKLMLAVGTSWCCLWGCSGGGVLAQEPGAEGGKEEFCVWRWKGESRWAMNSKVWPEQHYRGERGGRGRASGPGSPFSVWWDEKEHWAGSGSNDQESGFRGA